MNNPMLNLIKQMKNAKNPKDLMMAMVKQNPQFNQMMQMANQSGKTYEELFYEMANKQGVDPNEILNILR